MTFSAIRNHRISSSILNIRLISKYLEPNSSRYTRSFHVSPPRCKSTPTELCKQLKARIRMNGPITVADYMKEVLTNPVAGYYMHRDVFGSHGDFITSPEISQMFGELLGVWCVNEWLQCGAPQHIQVVELGPGRGTLAQDMLRVFSQFPDIKSAVSLHLVEVSPKLSEMQQERLSNSSAVENVSNSHSQNEKCYRQCQSKYGPPVSWYRQLSDVPRGFTFYVAHEFFDALPIHIFKKKDNRWHELLVDLDDSPAGEHHLRFVLSFNQTVGSKVLLDEPDRSERDHMELCPQGAVLTEEIAQRIGQDGGFALFADYGHSGEKSDTFRAFKDHKLYHPLCEPGLADLTADVDFAYLRKRAESKGVVTYGPITQESFLHSMGIGVRLQVLMGKADAEQRKNLITGYDMLTNPKQMGERFKFMAIMKDIGKEAPAGFTPL